MTTTFETVPAIEAYRPLGVSRVVDPYAAFNSLIRVPALAAASASAQASVRHSDTTAISKTSTLVAAVVSDTDLRTERIGSLRRSIAEGTYTVASSTVADSLVSLLLIGR